MLLPAAAGARYLVLTRRHRRAAASSPDGVPRPDLPASPAIPPVRSR
ncbi:hypothetical protein GCM10018781_59540 [Kitasatospora indigofera]|uniref:Uncharacterized protein n=1 Tax=Kitasatospora indigofera TaxID=67307 RepID=A0A919L1L1_9ACTN|nr:hypothetical protein GCM10018781_59540 [Kitasatospora indigofera]